MGCPITACCTFDVNDTGHSIILQGTELQLLPQKAVYWGQENTLFVADVHLGKEHVFGKSGIAIPAGSTEITLARLSSLLQRTGASNCVVLGDFFHGMPQASDSWLLTVTRFLDKNPDVNVTVVAGNHDKLQGRSMVDSRITWLADSQVLDPFVLKHEPGHDERGYVLAGHIHPMLSIKKPFKRGLRAPCFWQQEHCMVIPSFGDFTGGYTIKPARNDTAYLVGPEAIVPISGELLMNANKRGPRNHKNHLII